MFDKGYGGWQISGKIGTHSGDVENVTLTSSSDNNGMIQITMDEISATVYASDLEKIVNNLCHQDISF